MPVSKARPLKAASNDRDAESMSDMSNWTSTSASKGCPELLATAMLYSPRKSGSQSNLEVGSTAEASGGSTRDWQDASMRKIKG